MKNVGRIQVALLGDEGGGRGDISDGDDAVCVGGGRGCGGDGQWKHQERRRVFPLGTAREGGRRERLEAGVVSLGVRDGD